MTRCDGGYVQFTDAELRKMAIKTVTKPGPRFGPPESRPVPGIPVGLRATCPTCRRERVLVLPESTSGSGPADKPEQFTYTFWLRAHDVPPPHDPECENAPGGRYFGRKLHGQPIPCHCPARAQGRAEAARERTGK